MADTPSKDFRIKAYADWLNVLDYQASCFGREWPAGELKPHLQYDELVVLWRYGEAGRIYRDKERGFWSSTAKKDLRNLCPDEDDFQFHEIGFAFVGWGEDERVKSDIDYLFRQFWSDVLEDAKRWWDAMMIANRSLEK